MMMSFAAEPPSERTTSPCRRGNAWRNSGWLGDCGMPTNIGRPRSNTRTPLCNAASSASEVTSASGNDSSILEVCEALRRHAELAEHHLIGVAPVRAAGVADGSRRRRHAEQHVLHPQWPEV